MGKCVAHRQNVVHSAERMMVLILLLRGFTEVQNLLRGCAMVFLLAVQFEEASSFLLRTVRIQELPVFLAVVAHVLEEIMAIPVRICVNLLLCFERE